MSIHRTKLKVIATGELIDAELNDALSLSDLLDAQALWAPEKILIAKQFLQRGVDKAHWPQSLHWNWAEKAVALQPYAPGPLSAFRLFGIAAEGKWQGILLACSVGHHAKLGAPNRDLVYVDFVENAPWNWDLQHIDQKRRLGGLGRQLLELAVQWSEDLGLKGRTGLHSLYQSESFYRDGCKMTDLGEDPGYNPRLTRPLRYFEFSEAQARAFLGGAQP